MPPLILRSFVTMSLTLLLLVAAFEKQSGAAAAPVQQKFELNVVYQCNGERLIVARCFSEAPEAYCSVSYPDRKGPATKGMTPELAEKRGELIKKLQACGALAAEASPPASLPSGGYISPSSLQAKLGESYLKAKDYSRAVGHFKKSIELAPSSGAYYGLGLAYHELKTYPEAIEALRQAVRMAPNNSAAHLRLAMSYLSLGQQLARDPASSGHLKAYENSEKEAREGLRLSPDFPGDGPFILGNALFGQAKYTEALRAFQEALRLKADDTSYLFVIGLTYHRLGQKQNAMRMYERLKILDKEFAAELLDQYKR